MQDEAVSVPAAGTIEKYFNKTERYTAFILQFFDNLGYRNIIPYSASESVRSQVLHHTLERVRPKQNELCLEFGVYKGDSIRFSAKRRPNVKFHGFDSFEGFPDDGRKDWKQDFSVDGLPDVPANVSLVKGYFDKTLPSFLKENEGKLCFLNIDCDIYSSTKVIFDSLLAESRFRVGTIVYFDELINYDGFIGNELQAYFEFLEASKFGVDALWIHQHLFRLEESLGLLDEGKFDANWKALQKRGYRQQACTRLVPGGINYGPLLSDEIYAEKVRNLASRVEKYMT